ncbi:MAG: hypothetical protein AB2A00_11305 [Myxococcota bacterium]
MHDLKDVGGTPGGLVDFLVGLIMAAVGLYLLFDRVTVHGGYWTFFGDQDRSFGITLIPVLFGVGALFYNGRSILGWLTFLGGLLLIITGIIANLQIHFRSTSLLNTLIMLGLLAGGVGLILRALRPHPRKP